MFKTYLYLFVFVAFVIAGLQPKPETLQSNLYAAVTQQEEQQLLEIDSSQQQYFKTVDLAKGIEPIDNQQVTKETAYFRISYNSKQQPILVEYLEKGATALHPKQRWASLKVTYTQNKNEGNSILYTYHDNKGKRTLTEDGISAVKFIYNKKGQVIREQFLDTQDKLVNSKSLQFANKRILYNDANLVKEIRFFDTVNLPVNNKALNAAVLFYRYNDKGICTDTLIIDSYQLRAEE